MAENCGRAVFRRFSVAARAPGPSRRIRLWTMRTSSRDDRMTDARKSARE
jgi:hypothetical protein